MQFCQRLLDALGNQGRWDATAIEHELNQMSTMTKGYHEVSGEITKNREESKIVNVSYIIILRA